MIFFVLVSSTRTSLDASGYGSGRSRTASTMLKIAVLAPIPSARMPMTAAVKPGLLRSQRKAHLKSRVILKN